MYYPQNILYQEQRIKKYKDSLKGVFKPFIQSLYIDLLKEPNAKPKPIHLGYQLGRNNLIEHLQELQNIGVNHVIINLKYSKRNAQDIIDELGKYVIPKFC